MTDRHWRIGSWIVGGGFALLAALTFTDYGITWDEHVQHQYGQRVLRYYLSGFRDVSNESLLNLSYYGPLFESIAAAVAGLMPERTYDVRHALVAVTGLLTVIAVIKIAGQTWGAASGFFAALFLVLMPHFYGHSFNNSKDIPFACGVAWCIWAAARFLRLRNLPAALLAGLLIGLTMATRVGGIFLLPVTGVAFLATAGRHLRRDLLHLAALGLCAWMVMVASWPWTHSSPVGHPVDALRKATAFTEGPAVFFEGAVWPSGTLPLRYLPTMMALTTPVTILVLALAGFVLAVSGVVRDRAGRNPLLLIVLWPTVPVAVYFIGKPPLYDGIRHFLFLLPAMAILAAGALEHVRKLRYGNVIAGVVLLTLIPTGVAMVRLHPYQSTYYNSVAGGVGEASKHYETDYWLSSYREAMFWVNEHQCGAVTRVLVATDAAPTVTTYAEAGVNVTLLAEAGLRGPIPPPYDYYIATTRFNFAGNFPESPVAAVIGREGAVFSVIRGRCQSGGRPGRG